MNWNKLVCIVRRHTFTRWRTQMERIAKGQFRPLNPSMRQRHCKRCGLIETQPTPPAPQRVLALREAA